MMIVPHLTFNGNCKDAMAFYKEVFECEEGSVMSYGDYIPDGMDNPPDDLKTWVLFADMKVNGSAIWFADEFMENTTGYIVRLTATRPNKAEAQKTFDLLKVGGRVTMPPVEAFYSTFHASLVDKFGIYWHIIAEEAPPQA